GRRKGVVGGEEGASHQSIERRPAGLQDSTQVGDRLPCLRSHIQTYHLARTRVRSDLTSSKDEPISANASRKWQRRRRHILTRDDFLHATKRTRHSGGTDWWRPGAVEAASTLAHQPIGVGREPPQRVWRKLLWRVDTWVIEATGDPSSKLLSCRPTHFR